MRTKARRFRASAPCQRPYPWHSLHVKHRNSRAGSLLIDAQADPTLLEVVPFAHLSIHICRS